MLLVFSGIVARAYLWPVDILHFTFFLEPRESSSGTRLLKGVSAQSCNIRRRRVVNSTYERAELTEILPLNQ